MFQPKRVIFEQEALNYKMGKDLLKKFEKENVDVAFSNNGRITGIPGKDPKQMYFEGKNTLVVGIRRKMTFETCKPSAHYQLPLVSGCMGMCEYCYLNTQMGKKPYIKIHVNVDDMLEKATEYAKEREITVFEGAATSDPVPVEPYSGALAKAITFIGTRDDMLFRFVTKYTDVDSLLNLEHNGKTTVRFSINADSVIKNFEHRTPSFIERIDAACKIYEVGYKLGFIIAPVFMHDGWKEEYKELMDVIGNKFKGNDLKFEVISHRFTKRAKENIINVFPESILPMEEELRKFKFGQFGYGKYVYRDEELEEMKSFFTENLSKYFGEESISYII